jgi:hypothetical protein
MFDFKSVEAPQKLNINFILSKITQEQIFYYYFGKFDLKTVYPSKFGSGKHRDKNPSTGFYISTSGKIIYNHINGREQKMDCFAFVSRLYNISISDAIKRIAADFGLIDGKQKSVSDDFLKDMAMFDKTYKKDTRIHFVPGLWSDEAKAFWKSYHITKKELELEGVYPIKKLFINDIPIPNHTNSLRFALTVPKKDELLTKVYSPGGTDNLKWVSNIPLDRPFGVNTLNKNAPFSVTTKSVKDMIILKKFLPAVLASQNESRSAVSDETCKKLWFYFDNNNYIAWDADDTGYAATLEMEEIGFKPLLLPRDLYDQEGIKDWSDLAKEKGLNEVENLLKQYELI